jgi:hypothetical protein
MASITRACSAPCRGGTGRPPHHTLTASITGLGFLPLAGVFRLRAARARPARGCSRWPIATAPPPRAWWTRAAPPGSHHHARVAPAAARRCSSAQMDSGVSCRTGSAVSRSNRSAPRANRSFRWSFSSVIVPTVEREAAHRVGLVDGDGRRHAVHPVHRRFVHAVQELARVGAEGLDVAALAFGVQGVEHQAGFARPARPGDHGQFAGADVEVEVLQVVLARAADADQSGFGRWCGGLG